MRRLGWAPIVLAVSVFAMPQVAQAKRAELGGWDQSI
jgi:hypothetical protein